MALSSERICGVILEELRDHMVRKRVVVENEDAYVDQELLAERLHKFYRVTLSAEELTVPLTILKDAAYVQDQRIRLGPPERRRWLTAWKITGEGLRVLNGDIEEPRVKIRFP